MPAGRGLGRPTPLSSIVYSHTVDGMSTEGGDTEDTGREVGFLFHSARLVPVLDATTSGTVIFVPE